MARNTRLITDLAILRLYGTTYHDDYAIADGLMESTLMRLEGDDDVMDIHDIHPDNLGAEHGLTPAEYAQELAANDRTDGYNTWAEQLMAAGLVVDYEPTPRKIVIMLNTIQMVMYLSDEQLAEQIRTELKREVELTIGVNDDDARTIRRMGRRYGYVLADYHTADDGAVTIFDDPSYLKLQKKHFQDKNDAYRRGAATRLDSDETSRILEKPEPQKLGTTAPCDGQPGSVWADEKL